MHRAAVLDAVDPGYVLGEAIAVVVVLVVLAAAIGAVVLVLMVSWRLAFGVRRPLPPRAPAPPDDWDDEEYSARHHH